MEVQRGANLRGNYRRYAIYVAIWPIGLSMIGYDDRPVCSAPDDYWSMIKECEVHNGNPASTTGQPNKGCKDLPFPVENRLLGSRTLCLSRSLLLRTENRRYPMISIGRTLSA